MKKTLILIISVLFMIGLYGCGTKPKFLSGVNRSNWEHEFLAGANKHLNDKYGYFRYDVVGVFAAGWDYEYDLLNLAVEIDGQTEDFSVERHKTESGYVFQDNYFGLVIRPSFEEKISELAKEYFADYKVYGFLAQNYPDNLTKETQLDDLLALEEHQSIDIMVMVKNSFEDMEQFESVASAFVDAWSEEGVSSAVRVFCLSDEVYDGINRSNQSSVYVENNLAEYYKFVEQE